jgi:acyl phosphate:glycerol-3-phosphate acyltransferase
MSFVPLVPILLAAYLLGSFPTGYLAGKFLKGIDLREAGSGSTGATNVLRTLGKGPGAVVLAIDILKGAAAIQLIALAGLWQIALPDVSLAIVGAAAMALIGHSKSIWLGWKGGKSVATSLGVLLAMNWQVGLLTLGVFGVSIALTRIVSISSILGALAVTIFMVLYGQPLAYGIFTAIGGAYVIWLHRTNIQRLFNGTEPRLGSPSTTPENAEPQS